MSYMRGTPEPGHRFALQEKDSGPFTFHLSVNLRESSLVREATDTVPDTKPPRFGSQLLARVAWDHQLAGIWGLRGPIGSCSHFCPHMGATGSLGS